MCRHISRLSSFLKEKDVEDFDIKVIMLCDKFRENLIGFPDLLI